MVEPVLLLNTQRHTQKPVLKKGWQEIGKWGAFDEIEASKAGEKWIEEMKKLVRKKQRKNFQKLKV